MHSVGLVMPSQEELSRVTPKKPLPEVRIYTDGGCRGNPGCGGWAAILIHGRQRRTIAGAAAHTTNNRMEMMAAIETFRALKRPCKVHSVSDSQYMIQGITEWVKNWKRRNWLTADKKPVKNKELWQELDEMASKHTVTWEWIRGHAGHPENEECDLLANVLMDRLEGGEDPDSLRVDRRHAVR
jgi:ribonuclease HI